MNDIDIKKEIYYKIGERLLKNGNMVRNVFKPWNFIKFILDYKRTMKDCYAYIIDMVKGTNSFEHIDQAIEVLDLLKIHWSNRQEYTYINQVIGKYELLKNLTSREDYAYTPVKNRICYCLNHSLPYRGDGYVTRSQHMAEAMKNAGFDVIAVTRPGFPWDNVKAMKNRKDLPCEEEIGGILYKRQYLSREMARKDRYKYYDLAAQIWEKTFMELKPEYVIAASNNINAIPVLVAAKRLGIPFYYETRGLWEITRISKYPEYANTLAFYFEKYYEATVCNNAKYVFTLTKPLIDELESRGVNRDKICLVPNCANASMFNAAEKDMELAKKLNIPENVVTIGYLGTIQMYEGLDDLMKACAILKNKGIDFRLLLVGGIANIDKNDYGQYLKNLAKEINIEDKLIMPGKVPPTEVPKYYSLMDITPFGRKPLPVCEMVSPIKPLEAMAMKKTVIVSDIAALKEIVKDNETGLYFQKGNIESYAEILEKVIKDISLRERLGENARKWVEENRQWSQNAETIKQILTSKV